MPESLVRNFQTFERDAAGLAKLSRAGEPTAVWMPDERHEAMLDLSRAREAARKDPKGKRQQVSSFMLPLGRHYPGKKTWGPAHMNWLMLQKLDHREQRITSLIHPAISAFPESSGRPAHRPFRGLHVVHSRYGLHTRAVT
jgi:transposase